MYFDENGKEFGDLKNAIKKKFTIRPYLDNSYKFNLDMERKEEAASASAVGEHLKILRAEFDKKLEEFAQNAIELVNDKQMAIKEGFFEVQWQGHPFLKHEKLSKNDNGIIANANNNKEMAEEEKPNEEPSKKGID
ncbi:hypothetical protein niasHS_008681 [Heterodera schachtii]